MKTDDSDGEVAENGNEEDEVTKTPDESKDSEESNDQKHDDTLIKKVTAT